METETEMEEWGGADFEEWSSSDTSSWWSNILDWEPTQATEQQKLDQDLTQTWIDSGTKLLTTGISIIPSLISASASNVANANGNNTNNTIPNLAQSLGILQAQQTATSPTLLQSQLDVYKAQTQIQAQAQVQKQTSEKLLLGIGAGAVVLLILLAKR